MTPLEKSKRHADIHWALEVLGLQCQIGTRHENYLIGEITEDHTSLPRNGTIVLFRDDGDGTVTIERPSNPERIGNGVSLLTTFATMMNVPRRFVSKVDVMHELFGAVPRPGK